LLNAMHYQRSQIVTSALFVMIAIVTIGWFVLFIINKKILVSIVFISVLVSCQSSEQKSVAVATVIGSPGYSDNHFMTPRAIASDEQMIVVIDKSGRLQRFATDGTFLSAWELELSGTGYPTGVSIDNRGNIWIADTHQHRILVLDSEGNEVRSFGEYGTGDGQFLYPTDVAFGIDGEIFVSEYGGNDRINVFNQEGTFVRSIGHHGEDQNGFKRPQSIAVDQKTGYLYIADSGNHRIVVIRPSGEVVQIISEVGRGDGQMLYPYGILIDSPDSFLVCEFGTNRLQRFSMNGNSIATWGNAGSDIGFFRTPWGIAPANNGIVVADTGNNRLQLLPDMMTKQ
jgi:DNA-binding beta-propeller fold protein YncE